MSILPFLFSRKILGVTLIALYKFYAVLNGIEYNRDASSVPFAITTSYYRKAKSDLYSHSQIETIIRKKKKECYKLKKSLLIIVKVLKM